MCRGIALNLGLETFSWPRSKENDMNETKRSTPYLLHKEYLDSDDSNSSH
jgi:hypothetical protein